MSIGLRPRGHFDHPDFKIAALGLLIFVGAMAATVALRDQHPTSGWVTFAAGIIAFAVTLDRLDAWQEDVEDE